MIQLAASLARNSTAAATSCGSPKRPIATGSFSIIFAITSSAVTPWASAAEVAFSWMASVMVTPGMTQLASTP